MFAMGGELYRPGITVPARIPAIARRCSNGRASIAFHASLTRSGSVAAACTVRAIGCPAPRTCSMAFMIAGMLLGSKARIVLDLISLALQTTFPSVLLCGLSAFVFDHRFVQFACDEINEGADFGRKKTVRRVNCVNPRFILRGVHFLVSQNNFELTTVQVLFHDPSGRQEQLEPPHGGADQCRLAVGIDSAIDGYGLNFFPDAESTTCRQDL